MTMPSLQKDDDRRVGIANVTHLRREKGEESRCNVCSCTDNPIAFLLITSLHFLLVVASGSYFGGVISTMEKQFYLSSSTSGAIATISDASSLSVVLLLTYCGTKANRARIIGAGAVVASVGYFLTALPHFLNDAYLYQGHSPSNTMDDGNKLCNSTYVNTSSSELLSVYTEDGHTTGVVWLAIGQLLIGFGTSPLFPLTLTYLDDSTIDPLMTSVYIGVFMSMTGVGPIIGFFTSYKCLSLYVDFYSVEEENIPSGFRDPAWLGAWWLGYIIASIAILILSIPLFFFPRNLTKYECRLCRKNSNDDEDNDRKAIGSTVSVVGSRIYPKGLYGVIKDFSKVLRRVLVNPTLACVFLTTSCDLAIVGGFILFVAKYIQNQFGVSPAVASLVVGLTNIPGNIFGNILSSLIVKNLKLSLRGLSIMIIMTSMTSAVLSIPVLTIGCSNPPIAGVTIPYGNEQLSTLQYSSERCNANCACSEDLYVPVCGADNVTYVSTCYAGCTGHHDIVHTNGTNIMMVYTDCKCVNNTSKDDLHSVAVEGACLFSCDKLLAFSLVTAVISITATMRANPSLMIVLRCVDEEDKLMAMGYQALIVRALGFMPASIYFGAVISSTCLLRQYAEKGACLIYDLQKYRYGFIGLFVALKFVGLCCACCIFLSIKYWMKPERIHFNEQKEQSVEDATIQEEHNIELQSK